MAPFSMLLSAILTLFLTNVSSTFLTYDHQTLLNIGNQVYYLLVAMWSARRRGKQAGVAIRIKSGLLFGFTRPSDFPSLVVGPVSGCYVAGPSLERPHQ